MKFSVLTVYFVDDEPGMFLDSKSNSPLSSQMCCHSPPLLGKDIPRLSFPFSFRDGGLGKDWTVENNFPRVHHQSKLYYHPLSFVVSPIPQLC